MTNLLTPSLIESLQIPHQELTKEEWSSITDGDRPQCPPCCPLASNFNSVVRSIRGFGLDYQNAKNLVEEYKKLSLRHDYTMFPALMKLINNATALINRLDELRAPKKPDPNVRGLAGYAALYDTEFDEIAWGL